MSRVVFLFESTRAVIKAECLCNQNQITCKVLPVPREISSECGMVLQIDEFNIDQAASLLSMNELKYSIHTINDDK